MSHHRPSLWRVLSDTSDIISAHSRHFLALSLLFLLPTSIAAIIYPFLLHPTSAHSHFRRFLSGFPAPDSETPPAGKSQVVLIQVLYFLLAQLLYLCAASSITYSTFHAFYGWPLKLISSLKSILVSFFPLLATTLASEVIIGLINFVSIIFVLLGMEYGNQHTLVFVILIAASLVVLLIYLQVEWYLTNAVVVLESQWGFAPLRRSSHLVKGMRRIVFLTMLFFGIPSALSSVWCSSLVANAGRVNEGWTCWLVLQMVVFAGFFTVLPLYGLAATTVLFVYCKALHGELAFQTGEKLGVEYASLPFDVVNVV